MPLGGEFFDCCAIDYMQYDEPTVKGESTYSECTHDGEVVSQIALAFKTAPRDLIAVLPRPSLFQFDFGVSLIRDSLLVLHPLSYLSISLILGGCLRKKIR